MRDGLIAASAASSLAPQRAQPCRERIFPRHRLGVKSEDRVVSCRALRPTLLAFGTSRPDRRCKCVVKEYDESGHIYPAPLSRLTAVGLRAFSLSSKACSSDCEGAMASAWVSAEHQAKQLRGKVHKRCSRQGRDWGQGHQGPAEVTRGCRAFVRDPVGSFQYCIRIVVL